MESLKTKNQVLKTEKEKEGAKHEEEVVDVLDKHSKEMQDLGTIFLTQYYLLVKIWRDDNVTRVKTE